MIAAENLQLVAGARLLARGLDWAVAQGECWAIVGRNGAGKSTLLRTLAGVREPDGGRVLLGGRALPAWPLPALARERAYLAQSRSDPFAYRVIDTVLMARHPYQAGRGWEDRHDHERAMQSLAALDVQELAERDVRTLSGGERQRVAIAALLAQDTPLLLLDEPTAALDVAHQASVMRLLGRLCREQGRTVVMVVHDLNLVQGAASHALLLMEGGQWEAGTAEAMLRAPLLSACLGHPLEAVRHGGRTFFIHGEAA